MNNSTKIEVNKIFQYYLYKAKNTLWYFNDLIQQGFQGYNAVKFQNAEHVFVWLENVKIEDKHYIGALSENGSSQKVLIEDVVDWMTVENGRLIGGYTIRHYRDTLDEEAKLNFDIDFGVKIDEGNDYFRPNPSTPEGAIVQIENFYTEENLEGVISCKDFLLEAENLLLEKELAITEELKIQIAEILKSSLIENLKSNGFPSFKDIERSFMLIDEQEKQHLIEERVIYSDGVITFNNLWIGHSNGIWKVLNLVE